MNPAQATPSAGPSSELSDDEIVRRVCSGEPELFEILIRRHNQRLYRAVRAVIRDDGETEDVMQEAYVNAFSHLGDFEGRSQVSTWLTRIAIHEAFARLRRAKRLSSLDDAEKATMQNPAPTPSPEQRAADQELGNVLERAVETLPESFRLVFVLRAVEEMSVSETAEALEIPEETVKTRLFRARNLLRQSILDQTNATLPTLLGFHLSRCDRVTSAVLRRIGVAQ